MGTLNLRGHVSAESRSRDIWRWWVGHTVLGYVIVNAVMIAVTKFLPGGLLLGMVVGVIGTGVVVGFLQWSVLQRYIPNMGWSGWVLASVLGQLVGVIIGTMVGVTVAATLAPMLYQFIGGSLETSLGIVQYATTLINGAVLGTVIGFAQWLILRRYLLAAGWWMPATAGAMAVSSLVAKLWQAGIGSEGTIVLPLLAVSITGVIVGAITGVALAGLSRGPV